MSDLFYSMDHGRLKRGLPDLFVVANREHIVAPP